MLGTPINYALDTFYLLIVGLLVMCFAVGLILMGAGLVRAKNTLDLLTKNLVSIMAGSVIYILLGYTIMYNPHLPGHWLFPSISGGEQLLLHSLSPAIPHSFLPGLFLQWELAGLGLIIIANATAERIRPWVLWIFAAIYIGFIYPVMGYWAWGQGFLHQLGFIDYAGSGVIHLAAAAASFAALLLLGPRLHRYQKNRIMRGANIPLAVIGILFVWLGSMGVNISSQIFLSTTEAAQTIAVIIINTQLAIAGSVLAVLILTRLFFSSIDLTFLLNAVLAGIIGLAASPATMGLVTAFAIGIISGILVLLGMLFFNKLKIDDPVGVLATHGIVGLWGLFIVVFSQNYTQLSSVHGVVWHWYNQLIIQLIGAATIAGWVFVVSFIVIWLLNLLSEIRVNEKIERKGLDPVIYRQNAYNFDDR